MMRIDVPDPQLLNLPATASVELEAGLRYEGVWVEGRWEWVLWLGDVPLVWDSANQLGSTACN